MTNEENMAGGAQESKADRFKRLSEPRVSNAVKKIKLIGNLAGSSYEFTPEQVSNILTALKTSVEEVESKFQNLLKRRGLSDPSRPL
ncbi:MAG TPA: hypothetical protein VD883_02085 [Candidatus Omnitrophota bacterium]|nr:hypothetical protein [Candidatus Omnitrophota bacterium]